MHSAEAARQARLALLEAAMLSMIRAAAEDGYDGVVVTAHTDEHDTTIDVAYMQGDIPMAGESL